LEAGGLLKLRKDPNVSQIAAVLQHLPFNHRTPTFSDCSDSRSTLRPVIGLASLHLSFCCGRARLFHHVNLPGSQCTKAPSLSSFRIFRIPGRLELRADFLQVLRYSALIVGVFYGFSHQRSITANNAAAHAQAEYQHKVDLIHKAKLEWAKKTLPPQAKTASDDSR